jgi:hypothetical protein
MENERKLTDNLRTIVVAITMFALTLTIIGIPVALVLWQLERIIVLLQKENKKRGVK